MVTKLLDSVQRLYLRNLILLTTVASPVLGLVLGEPSETVRRDAQRLQKSDRTLNDLDEALLVVGGAMVVGIAVCGGLAVASVPVGDVMFGGFAPWAGRMLLGAMLGFLLMLVIFRLRHRLAYDRLEFAGELVQEDLSPLEPRWWEALLFFGVMAATVVLGV